MSLVERAAHNDRPSRVAVGSWMEPPAGGEALSMHALEMKDQKHAERALHISRVQPEQDPSLLAPSPGDEPARGRLADGGCVDPVVGGR